MVNPALCKLNRQSVRYEVNTSLVIFVTFLLRLVTQDPKTFSPAIAIDAALDRYTANVGELVDWILTIPGTLFLIIQSLYVYYFRFAKDHFL